MPAKCPYCEKTLPTGVDVATCPFCFKSMLVAPPSVTNQPFGRTLTEEDIEIRLGPVTPGDRTLMVEDTMGSDDGSGTGASTTAPDTNPHAAGTLVDVVQQGASPRSNMPTLAVDYGDGDETTAPDGEDSASTVLPGEAPARNQGATLAVEDNLNDSDAIDTLHDKLDSNIPAHEQWHAAAGSSRNPMHTVKADRASSPTDSLDLPVNLRTVAQRPAPVDRNADYQLIEIVGKGAMGLVHKAKQHSIDRLVAFKTIKKDRAERNPEARRKFLREAQITGSLDHPNIVPIHDLGISEDGTLFYSMKLVDGTPWQDVINRKSRDENLEILLKVCDAVAFAHAHNIIHRDLKPENIMLGQFGEVLVMDWGLAINMERDRGRGFSLGGTPAYMAPEMAWHDKTLIGPSSDIYLLGAILYQIVAAFPPHPGRTVSECVDAAKRNDIIPLDDPDDALAKIALRAMANEPRDRYATVADLQEAIRQYRRNAESVALTQRAEASLDRAMSNHDYQDFAKALFAFNDAIEIWPENHVAREGIGKARLEYGKVAVEQGDFDLALQVLDNSVPAERPLYDRAQQGKREASLREQRIRRLRLGVLSTIAVALLGALAASGYLLDANKRVSDTNIELAANEEALKFTIGELQEKEKQVTLEKEKVEQANITLTKQSKEIADQKTALEKTNADLESTNKDLIKSQEAEQKATKEAQDQAAAATKAKNAELAQSRLNLFQNYPAKLNLASVRLQRQQDVRRSRSLLSEIDRVEEDMARQYAELIDAAGAENTETRAPAQTPLIKNWAYRRVRLLGNEDLPQLQLFPPGSDLVTSLAIADQVQVAAIGTRSGRVFVLNLEKGQIQTAHERLLEFGTIHSLAVSPSGESIAICADQKWLVWNPGRNEQRDVSAASKGPAVVDYGPREEGLLRVADFNNKLFVRRVDNAGLPIAENNQRPANLAATPRQFANVPGQPGGTAVLENQRGAYQRIQFGTTSTVGPPLDFTGLTDVLNRVVFYSPADIVAGTETGEFLQFKLIDGKWSAPLVLQGSHFRRPITQMAISNSGDRFIAIGADSPGLQLWHAKKSTTGQDWEYQGPMLGHESSELAGAAFLPDNQTAMSVATDGQCLMWNLNRFEKNQHLQNENFATAPSHTISTSLVSTDAARAPSLSLSVNDQGALNVWELFPEASGGEVSNWSYPGHAPDAGLIDVAITPNGKFMVSVVSIDSGFYAPKGYYQFCLWNLESRTILHRWEESRSVPPTVAISPNGTSVFVSGSGENALIDLRVESDGKVSKSVSAAPISPLTWTLTPDNQVMTLVGEGGRSVLLAADPPHTRNTELIPPNFKQLIRAAAWSPQSDYLFLLQADTVQVIPRAAATTSFSPQREIIPSSLPSDPRAIDLLVTQEGNTVLCYLALRGRRDTQLLTLKVGNNGENGGQSLDLVTNETLAGQHWLIPRGPNNSPQVTSAEFWAERGIRDASLVKSTTDGARSVVASSAGNFVIVDSPLAAQRLSRPVVTGKCNSATIAKHPSAGWISVTHTADSMIWLARPEDPRRPDTQVNWLPLDLGPAVPQQLALSPSGELLAVVETSAVAAEMRMAVWNMKDPAAPQLLGYVPGISDALWHPSQNQLVTYNNDQKQLSLRDFDAVNNSAIPDAVAIPLPADLTANTATSRLKPLNLFRESFADADLPPAWHVILGQLPTNTSDSTSTYTRLIMVPVEGPSQDASSPGYVIIDEAGGVTAVSASPTENVVAVGYRSGTVSVWLAAPSLTSDSTFEVFDFEAHRGSAISQLKFGPDGKTLITSDAIGVQFGWVSEPAK